ncbi:MAG TPA: hypothetical protein VF157_15270, partial [Chloroflexota bacterium]
YSARRRDRISPTVAAIQTWQDICRPYVPSAFRILIVAADDDRRLLLRTGLAAAGWAVDLAPGPAEATRLALRQRPDVALLALSPADAVATVAGLRWEHGDELPIVALADAVEDEVAENLGLRYVLSSDIGMDKLHEELSKITARTGLDKS